MFVEDGMFKFTNFHGGPRGVLVERFTIQTVGRVRGGEGGRVLGCVRGY